MKKMFVLLILITMLLFSACSEIQLDISQSTDEPEGIPYYNAGDIEIYYPTHPDLCLTSEMLSKWSDCLSELSSRKISVEYIDSYNEDDNYYNGLERTKLVYINNKAQLDRLTSLNLIIPVNTYLEQIKGAEYIMQSAIEYFTDDAGDCWALPTSINRYYYPRRTYNKEWLQSLGINPPSNIDELTMLARLIKEEDYGDSQKEDYLAVVTDYKQIISEFMDVFIAFGCYPNVFVEETISYNFIKQKYEMIALTDEFKEALSYIKYLIDSNLVLDATGMNADDIRKNYDICTGKYSFSEDYAYGLYLEGNNKEKLIYDTSTYTGIAVMKDTDDVKEKLSFFINEAFYNNELIDSFNLGIKDYHYEETNEYIIRITKNNDKDHPITSIRMNILQPETEQKPIFISSYEYDANINAYQKRNAYIEAVSNLDKKYILNYDSSKLKSVISVDEIEGKVQVLFDEMMMNIFYDHIGISDAIGIFKKAYQDNNYDDYVNSLNSGN